MVKDNASQRFMRATGKLRAIFGPANRSSLVHDMTEENRKSSWPSVRRRASSGRRCNALMAAPMLSPGTRTTSPCAEHWPPPVPGPFCPSGRKIRALPSR